MSRSKLIWGIVVSVFLLGIIVTSEAAVDLYMPASFLLVLASLAPFWIRFERKRMEAREIVLIAVLAAIAAVGRIPFAAIPSVQPTTFVIIVSALVFGAETGFFVGATAAFVSNLFLGQGPWTPWQMFAWGMIGLSAGLMRDWKWMQMKWGKMAFGFIWGFLFGWIMNVWLIAGLLMSLDLKEILLLYVASFYFDLAHAVTNVILLGIFATSWMRILHRVKNKYGLLESSQ